MAVTKENGTSCSSISFATQVPLNEIPKAKTKLGTDKQYIPFEGFKVPDQLPDHEVFEPSTHLQIEPCANATLHGDYPNRTEHPGPLAYAGPFRVLSDEGIKAVRKEIDFYDGQKDVSRGAENKRIAHCLRGLSYKSKFIFDFGLNEELCDHLSTLAGEKIIPQNIQSNHLQANFGEAGTGRKIDQWHGDSCPYVLVIVISDLGPGSIGGELQCITERPDDAGKLILETEGKIDPKDLLTVPNTNIGYGVFVQGSEIVHHVTSLVKANGPRISIVLPYMPANPFAKEQTTCEILRGFDGDLAFEEYAKHRAWRTASQLIAFMKGDTNLKDPKEIEEFFNQVEKEIKYTKDVIGEREINFPWMSPFNELKTIHDKNQEALTKDN